ncbi:hypothetical protein PI23P_04662 [Polaribacter irgensii 23-P]|uniref:DUF177 domain-containing protein n=1 Tax=Polaribacter irgensii 23-P TaxID=313594 RepID=A4BXR9_9FLAO|nr:DUF177 domain-containing protein [Polaribacter irgensii]EAR13760.1 hypothetical protein PI23P_04662 [Polaribacter irgensii 23-P]
MKDLKQFDIPFVGLKEGKHVFEYHIDTTFFEIYNYREFGKASVKVTLEFVKKSTLFELNFTATGTVHVPCDLTNEYFDQEITATLPLVVKFGPEYNDENEEILILPHEVYQFSVAQFIYEMIVLGVPSKRIHPDVILEDEETDETQHLEGVEKEEEKTVEITDPRWDKLKNLITEKKT